MEMFAQKTTVFLFLKEHLHLLSLFFVCVRNRWNYLISFEIVDSKQSFWLCFFLYLYLLKYSITDKIQN